MWCSECQADVAPSPDAPSSCGRCGGRLRMAGDATIREARDIISRWSSSDMLDRISSLPPIPEMSSTAAQNVSAQKVVAGQSSNQAALGRLASGKESINSSDLKQSSFDDFENSQSENSHSDGRPHQRHESGQTFDDSDVNDETAEPELDSESILADLDKLALQANIKPSDSDKPSAEYLKLAEIERPGRQAPAIDVTDLLKSEPFSHAEKQSANPTLQAKSDRKVGRPKQQPASQQHVKAQGESENARLAESDGKQSLKRTVASEKNAAKQTAVKTPAEAAPSLSSLLKQSKSASVGQLAWKIEDRRNQRNQEIDESYRDADKQSAEIDASDLDESVQSESPSQLRSGGVQTKNDQDPEAKAEFKEGPENLSDSDQVDQKATPNEFSQTLSEEVDADQPILPEKASDDDQSSTHPASADSQRAAQPRKAQRRKQHPRKLKQAASGLDDDDQKGMNTVSRKYRVDNPNPESVEPAVAGDQQQAPAANSNSNSTGRRFRIDSAESMDHTLDTADSRVRTQGRSRQRYIDEPHGTAIRGPHFEVVGKKRSNMASMTGQFLAYLGVLGLTVGTAIVIYGHFGGMSEYTPTGWLVTTVAQMMLFLGVINLVSGGIEQNNDDVSVRINTLGEQLMRIEQVTEQALRGPKIPASRYADPDSQTEETRTRETVEVNK